MKARKRFGQHFLVDEGVLDGIVRAVRPSASDRLLEIGPGPGALTARLHQTFANRSSDVTGTNPVVASGEFVAVEIDRDLAPPLRVRFPALTVINDDILRVDLDALLSAGRWRIVGNLPYNISTPLLVRLLAHLPKIADMHFMLQREVAERLAAQPGTKDWGRLTVLTQLQCEVEQLFDVAPECFSPPPRVWSAVVRIRPRSSVPEVSFDAFDQVLRHAFTQRRKRLSNALHSLPIDWARAGVDPGKRADAVTVAEYVALARALASAFATEAAYDQDQG
ncbi:MAG: 16S rRNA (adenine(1518)-N(6)/adenine(1519)-N(6))-dimethyltransferase RsmA [Pseudomonadales bacterium]|jgi:16S rRNA (adenine1518-N6/adenine1519-N6)-dimethyltransferase